VFPAAPANLGPQDLLDAHERAWRFLQAGDTKAADRDFGSILRISPGFYPAEAGLGYSAFARRDSQAALAHFDRALAANTGYAPALAGRGDALLALGRNDAALVAFQSALAADPGLTALRERVGVLKFRVAQDNIANARKAADAGRFDEALRRYQSAIVASPDSEFLYRELASVQHRSGDEAAALTNAQKAASRRFSRRRGRGLRPPTRMPRSTRSNRTTRRPRKSTRCARTRRSTRCRRNTGTSISRRRSRARSWRRCSPSVSRQCCGRPADLEGWSL
jgi:tetratricopeptide (TPR) repeat protein